MEVPESEKKRRGTSLVQRIVESTLTELYEAGYERLSIERVARRADVNKTTIYRRWPTPQALAEAALDHVSDREPMPDTGSIRGDLIEYVTRIWQATATPETLQLLRTRLSGNDPGLWAAIQRRTKSADEAALVMFRRGIDRGELPSTLGVELVRDVVLGAAQYFRAVGHIEEGAAERIVDLVLHGALATR